MKPVVQVVEAREQAAAKDFGLAQRQLNDQTVRLNELRSYRNEYRQQADALGSAGIPAARYIEMQRFLGSLNAAIEQQQLVVEQATRLCEEKRRRWHEARTKSKSIDKVVQHYVQHEQHEESRREQKETDEVAQNKGRSDPEQR